MFCIGVSLVTPIRTDVYYIYMTQFKEYIAQNLIGKKLHFKCDCIFPMDFIGIIKGYSISNNEMIFDVDKDGKIIQIGENHPKLSIEEV